jgi:hypothetical protein
MASVSRSDLLALLADELDAAHAQLEALGLALADDAALAHRHLVKLQALDHAGQRCASVATILRAEDLHAAARGASLDSIAGRAGGA